MSGQWISTAEQLPDDGLLVLVAMDDGDVWPAYMNAGDWLYVCSGLIEARRITHWMDFPEAPQ